MEETKTDPFFQTEKVELSDGSTFSVPSNAIQSIKDILVKVKEQQILPDEEKVSGWHNFGHTIGNAASSLNAKVFLGELSDEDSQTKELLGVTKKILENKGPEVLPLLKRIGFPVI